MHGCNFVIVLFRGDAEEKVSQNNLLRVLFSHNLFFLYYAVWVLTLRYIGSMLACFSHKDLVLISACEIKRNWEGNAIKDCVRGKDVVREIYFKSLKINRCRSL